MFLDASSFEHFSSTFQEFYWRTSIMKVSGLGDMYCIQKQELNL